MVTIFKFEYIKHPTIPLKDNFKSTEIRATLCGDKYISVDGDNVVTINELGKLVNGTVMFLTENNPRKFVEAIVRKTEDSINLHKKYVDHMLQRKSKWEYWLLDRKE